MRRAFFKRVKTSVPRTQRYGLTPRSREQEEEEEYLSDFNQAQEFEHFNVLVTAKTCAEYEDHNNDEARLKNTIPK